MHVERSDQLTVQGKRKDTPREEGDFEMMAFSAESENASCKAVFEDDRQFFLLYPTFFYE